MEGTLAIVEIVTNLGLTHRRRAPMKGIFVTSLWPTVAQNISSNIFFNFGGHKSSTIASLLDFQQRDVPSGFQNRGRSPASFLICVMLRFTFGATPADSISSNIQSTPSSLGHFNSLLYKHIFKIESWESNIILVIKQLLVIIRLFYMTHSAILTLNGCFQYWNFTQISQWQFCFIELFTRIINDLGI